MRPALAVAALAALALGFLAACTDDDPLRISGGDSTAFSVHPQLSRFGASVMLPIDVVRLTVVSLPDSAQVMDPVEIPVGPSDPTWNLHLDVPLMSGPIDVLVFVELINDSAGTVEWSGVAGPFSLTPGGNAEAPTVQMFRGSLANLSITSVAIAGEDSTTEGAPLVLRASAIGAASPQFFWSTLDPTIVELGDAALDSAAFLPLAPGIARIVVEAGPRADTLEVQVRARIAALAVAQDADTLTALLTVATFGAAALDARADTVPDVVFTWASSDSLIARSLGDGVFEARAPGTVTVTATTPRAPELSVTAELTVRQDVDTIVIGAAPDTLASGASVTLAATAKDANAQPIAGAALVWSSDDSSVVSIDSTDANVAHVTARDAGTTVLRASLDGASTAVGIVVTPGAVASVVVAPPTLSLESLGESACLSATVSDAAGNPTGTTVTWSSRDESVATVDAAGCVTAVANGDAYVLAMSAGVSDSANVHVAQVATAVVVDLADPEIAAGAQTSASGIASDAGGSAITGAVFAWSSSDESVATVAADGTVSAVDVGGAWIRGVHDALVDSVQLTVTAGQAASVSMVSGDGQTGTVATQLTDSLVVLVADALGNPVQGASVTLATASGSLAPASPTTDAQGHAVAYWTLGTTAGSVSASAAIAGDTVVFHATAEAGALASIDVEPDTISFAALGQTQQLSAATLDAFGNDCGCAPTWFSQDETIATVDAAGLVTAAGSGTTWIVANVSGVRDSALVASFPGAAGASIVWTGLASSDWSDAANWNTAILPTGADTVLIPAEALVYPSLAGTDSVAGLIIDSLAALTVDGALTVVDYVLADAPVDGSGVLRLQDAEVRASASEAVVQLPALEVTGSTLLWHRVLAIGDVAVLPGAYLELTVGGLQTTGDLSVIGDDAFLSAWDSLLVGGALQVGGAESVGEAYLQNHAAVVVGDSLLVTGRGMFEFTNASTTLRIEGDARWDSEMWGEGVMPDGLIEVAGNWHMENQAFRTTGLPVHFIGTSGAQTITHLDLGTGANQGFLGPVHVANPAGVVFLTPSLLRGDLTTEPGVSVTADSLVVEGDVSVGGELRAASLTMRELLAVGAVYDVAVTTFVWPFADVPLVLPNTVPFQELRVEADTAEFSGRLTVGDLIAAGVVRGDTLRVSGGFQAADSLVVAVIDFSGTGQTIPAATYQGVLVSGSNAIWSQPGSIAGDLTVTGDLTLDADLAVGAATTLVGVLQPAGNTLRTVDLTIAGGFGLAMVNPGDSVIVTGAAEFLGGSGSLLDGTLLVESGGSFHSVGDAFRSGGTVLHMRGASLRMENAGPAAGQGMLSSLVLEAGSGLALDSAYVSGNVTDVAAGGVFDAGGGTWHALLRVDGDILAPNTGFTLEHISVGGALVYDFGSSDVDMTTFTGTGQTIPVEDAAFQPISHGTIVVTGADVHLGTDTTYTDIASDVIVREPGTLLTIHSNDNGFIGSLAIENGDATTRVVIHDDVTVRDSVVLAAGVLDLGGRGLDVNDNGFAGTALLTTGSGVIEMNDALDRLRVLDGDARFGGGSTDGSLTAGVIEMADSTTFFSRGDAFRSTGTALQMYGDTIEMEDAGFAAGQGQLWNFQFFDTNGLEVVDSLFVANNLDDAEFAMLHDQAGDALVRVGGTATFDSSQVVLSRFVVDGALSVGPVANWAADTTEFTGNGQVIPVLRSDGFGSIPYANIVVTGDSVSLGTPLFDPVLGSTNLFVRGSGTTLIVNGTSEAYVNSLVMQQGDATQRVRLARALRTADSVHVGSGVLDLNGFQLTANEFAREVALRTTGSGTIEMNQPGDRLVVEGGWLSFEGGSTRGLLTAGDIVATYGGGDYLPNFRAVGEAFHATGTHARLDVDSIVIVDGGTASTQARFAGLTFGGQPQVAAPLELDGHLVIEDSIADFVGSGNGIFGLPGSQITVLGTMRGTIARYDVPRLTAYQNVLASRSSNVDVLELAGSAQVVSDALSLIPNTMLVTGADVRVDVDSMGFLADTLAGTVHVRGGMLTLGNGPAGSAVVRDSLIISDGGVFDPNQVYLVVGDQTLADGALATSNGGILVMQRPGVLQVNGNADFRGGDTDGALIDGTLLIRGDFNAEKGAFQAAGQHLTAFDFTDRPIKINMPDGGVLAGTDHFNDLRLGTNDRITLVTSVFALGNLYDHSDAPATQVDGVGVTLLSDGWDVSSGALSFSDVTVEMNDEVNRFDAATTTFDGVAFGPYPSGVTRMRIRHPGLPNTALMSFIDVDLNGSTSDPGIYVHAVDTDETTTNNTLNVFLQGSVSLPADYFDRLLAENGAMINVAQ